MAFHLFSANSLSPFFGKQPFLRAGSKRSPALLFISRQRLLTVHSFPAFFSKAPAKFIEKNSVSQLPGLFSRTLLLIFIITRTAPAIDLVRRNDLSNPQFFYAI